MPNFLDALGEHILGAPGSIVDSPEQKQSAKEAREKATSKIIEERNNRGGGATKKEGGKRVADLGFLESLVTGKIFGGNSDAATEVQKGVGELQEVGRTEDYVNANQDAYPGLKDYDTSGGYKGAEKIVKQEKDLVRGAQRLEDLGLSLETLNSNIGESGLTQLDADKRYTSAQLAPYITQYNQKLRKDERAPELKLLTDKLNEQSNARKASDQRAEEAQTNLQEYRLYEGKRRTHEAEQETLRRAHELTVKQAEGKADRNQTFDLAVMNMQNADADRMYRREADERQSRRDDRKDRQLMIMQMIKGLQQFGSAMSF